MHLLKIQLIVWRILVKQFQLKSLLAERLNSAEFLNLHFSWTKEELLDDEKQSSDMGHTARKFRMQKIKYIQTGFPEGILSNEKS
jgi:hypothetical protein